MQITFVHVASALYCCFCTKRLTNMVPEWRLWRYFLLKLAETRTELKQYLPKHDIHLHEWWLCAVKAGCVMKGDDLSTLCSVKSVITGLNEAATAEIKEMPVFFPGVSQVCFVLDEQINASETFITDRTSWKSNRADGVEHTAQIYWQNVCRCGETWPEAKLSQIFTNSAVSLK